MISVKFNLLVPVSSIAFPNLREVTIRSGTARYFASFLPVIMESVPTIQATLHSPNCNIKRVNFNGHFAPAILDAYLNDCSPNINSLGLDLRNIDQPVETDVLKPLQDRKIELSHLALLNSKIIFHWLLHPCYAFAVSRLRTVETDAYTWFSLQDKLASSLPSLESLIIVDCTFGSYLSFTFSFLLVAIPKYLDLSTLPALRLLDVCIPPSSTHHSSLMSVLLRPPAHRNLDIITIRINITIR
jgi:hypothetical protein